MIKQELFSKYGIVGVYDREDITSDLFSFNSYDPMLAAESDGYELADGKPFITKCSIGSQNTCLTTVIVFKDYKSKVDYVDSGVIITNL